MQLFDTHCHVHEMIRRTTPVYDKWREDGLIRDPDIVLAQARSDGIAYLLCVGTTLNDSELAAEFVANHENTWASIGIHPHEAHDHLGSAAKSQLAALATKEKVVAIGECGLDYFYTHSPRAAQLDLLHFQLTLAQKHNLPVVFHVREAFDDFWPIFEQYPGIRGVLHSFTDTQANLDRALGHGLHIGVNGIATFTKNQAQLDMYRSIPLQNLLLETDAPFLTPTPYRGKICEPKHVRVTAEFVSNLRHESLEQLAKVTTANAKRLFRVSQ